MLSFLATHPPRTKTAHLNPITYEDGRTTQHFLSPSSPYMMRDTIPATTSTNGRSMFNPPMHYHATQTEEFHVISGTARFFVDGETHIRTASSSTSSSSPRNKDKDDNSIQFIPLNAFHCFENASPSSNPEDLVIEFRLDTQDWDAEESFFRNFFGYLDDCRKAGVKPSVFQLQRFLWGMKAPIVLGGVRSGRGVVGRVVRVVSWWVMIVMAGWAEWGLGYRGSYEEYYDEKKRR